MNCSEIEHALENCEFFKGLGKEDIEKIAALCRIETYKAGEYVFRQHDYGEYIYVICEGHVFLERSRDLGERKGSVLIAALGKGRVLGCWSTLLGESHVLMSSATCQKATKVVVMKGSDLRNMMLSNASLGCRILERCCFLLRDRIQAVYGALEKI